MARHPNKEIEAALQYARSKGWSVIKSLKGHCWGIIRCSHGRGGSQKSVWSTPKNPQNHAKAISSLRGSLPAPDECYGWTMKTHSFTLILSGVAKITPELA